MIPQERDLITDLFNRLRAADTAPKDPEAEDLIRRLSTEHPGASYLLTQTVLVQEQALTQAQTRIEELQRQLAQAQAQAAQAARPAAGTGSFLGGKASFLGAFGRQPPPPPANPWAAQPQPQPQPPPPPQPGPWGAPPSPWSAPRSGGFLQSAMATAAGVAGGALLFEGIEHMMGGSSGGLGQTASTPIVENTTVNNYYGDQSRNDPVQTGSDSAYDSGGDAYYDDV